MWSGEAVSQILAAAIRTIGGQIPAGALCGYGVDASLMSSWLHGGGIHIECGPPGPVLVMLVVPV
jgi:hypothetical protein